MLTDRCRDRDKERRRLLEARVSEDKGLLRDEGCFCPSFRELITGVPNDLRLLGVACDPSLRLCDRSLWGAVAGILTMSFQ